MLRPPKKRDTSVRDGDDRAEERSDRQRNVILPSVPEMKERTYAPISQRRAKFPSVPAIKGRTLAPTGQTRGTTITRVVKSFTHDKLRALVRTCRENAKLPQVKC